jgi:hypothetical protein
MTVQTIRTAIIAEGRYLVVAHADTLSVATTDEAEAAGTEPVALAESVPGLAAFVARATDLRIGYATTADFEIAYVYDRADGGFGYALNITAPDCSEWGYAPLACPVCGELADLHDDGECPPIAA